MAHFDNSVWRQDKDLRELRHNSLPWLVGGIGVLLAGYGLLQHSAGTSPAVLVLSLLLYAGMACGIWVGLTAHLPHRYFGPANGITLLRAVLVCLLAGFVGQSAPQQLAWLPLGAALVILLLDGVDGWLARRTGYASAFGARFDMETDSLLVLVLCATALLMGKAGPWILLAGGLRYLFLAGKALLPWMKGDLPDSFRRKTLYVASTTGVIVILAPTIIAPFSFVIAAIAVICLSASFAIDVVWLYRNAEQERTSR
ncbi:CDP-alcohol phosphatidyltransferase family protein [Fodinicurvata halophila]|uniref:CDP-alcohol phosphatidyltransferase family protein n=1 Tax=Fodinicurvata halophila TaxID=1419723 RepID=A0ABV8UKB7_9PROT